MSHTLAICTYLLLIRVIEWSRGRASRGHFLWPPSCAGKSHLYWSGQSGPWPPGHPHTKPPAPPLQICLPVRKPFFILIQICLLALFPHWPSSALCSSTEQRSVGVAWLHFLSLEVVLMGSLPFSSPPSYLPPQGPMSPVPSAILVRHGSPH